MSDTDFFTAPGRFYRGNLHTHSTLSDGMLEPAEVCRRYKAEGYDFISLTDHFVGLYGYPITDTVGERSTTFTTLLGAEVHTGQLANGEIWHLLAVGLPEDFRPPVAPNFDGAQAPESAASAAQRCVDAGAFVAIAHPQWFNMTLEDARTIEAAHAVEIYNHSCHVDSDRGDGTAILDQLLSDGRRLSACATDDAHFRDPDHFGGWVMVKAEANEPDALLAALKAGHFYASQGPDIHGIEVDGDVLRVTSSAVETVVVQGHGAAAFAKHGASMTKAELDLTRLKGSGWLRVTVVDRAGKKAWSNPIRLD